MRRLTYLALFLSCLLVDPRPASAEENSPPGGLLGGEEFGAIPPEVLRQLKPQPGESDPVQNAVAKYLQEIDQIEKQATQAKAEARARLLDALGQKPADPPTEARRTKPGLIGTAIVDGQQSGVAFHYEHGKLFLRELVWDRFHKQADGQTHFPDLNITLVGYVEVPHEMTVKISHAAGGVNRDHGTLFVGERQLGQVGDDTAKAEVYLVTLPSGVQPIRWMLTGGTFQNSLLKFEDPRTGELLRVFHDDAQRQETRAADAREGVEVSADPSEWVTAMGPNHWRWVPLAK